MTTFHAEGAWLGRLEADVAIDVGGDGLIGAVRTGVPRGPDDHALPGIVVPGFVNAHSHAFHRALRGRTHRGTGDFWQWRETMYEVAARLDPEVYLELARATFAEMALAGYTSVFEFHYLHHDRDGKRYSDPNEMSVALARAAEEAGIRMTLLDTCYLRPGLRGGDLDPVQRRFADADVEEWGQRVRSLSAEGLANVGVALHSVRAVDRGSMPAVAELAKEMNAPLHVHVSEQRRENDECQSAHDMSPTELLADAGVLGPRTTAVHATHVTPMDVELLAMSRTSVCMCPTTERDLGDGVGPTSVFRGVGIPVTLGSDSHAVIDPFEEARCAELHERMVAGRRGLTSAADLFDAATAYGAIEPGAPADLVAIDPSSVRSAGGGDDVPATVVFSATAADVTDVVVGGRVVVTDRRHTLVPDVAGSLQASIAALLS